MSDGRRIFSDGQVPLLRSLPSSFFSNQANLLSSRQLLELNESVLQYLKPILKAEPETYQTIEQRLHEKNLQLSSDTTKNIEIPDNYLQKKWSTVLRLQRNIQELEMKNRALEERNTELTDLLQQSLANSKLNGTIKDSLSKINWLPSFIKASLKYHTSPVTATAIHPFNPYIVTASQDGTIVLWNWLDLSEPMNQIKNAHSKSINSLIFQTNSSNLISCSSDQIIKVWDLSNPDTVRIPVKLLTGHEHIISSLAISNEDPNMLFSCSRDKTIKVWDLQTGWTVRSITPHSDWIRSIDTIGEYIISCSSDTSVRLTHWPTGTGIGICLGHKQVIESIKFIPTTANFYLDGYVNKTLGIADSNEDAAEYLKLGYKYAVSCGRDKLIKIWKLPLPEYNTLTGNPMPNSLNPYGTCIADIKGHQSWVRDIQIHYNGKCLFTCSDDQTIKIWDFSTFEEHGEDIQPVKVLHGHQSFVNTITIAYPITDENDENDEIDDNKIRCYLVSGGADNLVNVWT